MPGFSSMWLPPPTERPASLSVLAPFLLARPRLQALHDVGLVFRAGKRHVPARHLRIALAVQGLDDASARLHVELDIKAPTCPERFVLLHKPSLFTISRSLSLYS